MTEWDRILLVLVIAYWLMMLFAPRVPRWTLRKSYWQGLMSRNQAACGATFVLILFLIKDFA